MASLSFIISPSTLAHLRKHPPYRLLRARPLSMTSSTFKQSILSIAASAVLLFQPLSKPPPIIHSEPTTHSLILATNTSSVIYDRNLSLPTLTQAQTSPTPSIQTAASSPNSTTAFSIDLHILLRLSVAVACGAIIGVERRAAKSTAGIRTFSLVSLGAALFMVTALAARAQGHAGDPARMAASVATGVGFLGAGSITKNRKEHRGLTTAAGIWIAAALGVSAACGLFLLSFGGAVVTAMVARYARLEDVARENEDAAWGAKEVLERERWEKRERRERGGKGQLQQVWRQSPLDFVLLSTGGARGAWNEQKRAAEQGEAKDSADEP